MIVPARRSTPSTMMLALGLVLLCTAALPARGDDDDMSFEAMKRRSLTGLTPPDNDPDSGNPAAAAAAAGAGAGEGGEGVDIGNLGNLGAINDLLQGLNGGAAAGDGAAGGGGCPSGQAYVPRIDYRPEANGCGPAGMRQRDGDVYGLHECCNGHDTCYSACGTTFDYCEKQFKRCMQSKCKASKGGSHCEDTATAFAGMTAMFGQNFHQQGMQEACQCVPEAEASRQNTEYFVNFYKTCAQTCSLAL
jgi:hypothetical protein